ncbi:10692_t:CDS:2 [Dentiscutata erythropus]|uniref:10692_t:CDS:1 n=1 Tax=Dentiscutata erythropus TaxID=1348616 RepID=A0A9N9C5F7_9GLOM|nr:10692_t:CDS:2 [Dentiscutata erythropus]
MSKCPIHAISICSIANSELAQGNTFDSNSYGRPFIQRVRTDFQDEFNRQLQLASTTWIITRKNGASINYLEYLIRAAIPRFTGHLSYTPTSTTWIINSNLNFHKKLD